MESHTASTRFVSLFARKLCQFSINDQVNFFYPTMDPDADNTSFAHLWIMLLNTTGIYSKDKITFTTTNGEELFQLRERIADISQAFMLAVQNGKLETSIECGRSMGIAKSLFLSYGFGLDDTHDDILKLRWVA